MEKRRRRQTSHEVSNEQLLQAISVLQPYAFLHALFATTKISLGCKHGRMKSKVCKACCLEGVV